MRTRYRRWYWKNFQLHRLIKQGIHISIRPYGLCWLIEGRNQSSWNPWNDFKLWPSRSRSNQSIGFYQIQQEKKIRLIWQTHKMYKLFNCILILTIQWLKCNHWEVLLTENFLKLFNSSMCFLQSLWSCYIIWSNCDIWV